MRQETFPVTSALEPRWRPWSFVCDLFPSVRLTWELIRLYQASRNINWSTLWWNWRAGCVWSTMLRICSERPTRLVSYAQSPDTIAMSLFFWDKNINKRRPSCKSKSKSWSMSDKKNSIDLSRRKAALIYSFTGCSFTQKLYLCFNPGLKYGSKNSAPLVLPSPVRHSQSC